MLDDEKQSAALALTDKYVAPHKKSTKNIAMQYN
jgi:hypothetical protein